MQNRKFLKFALLIPAVAGLCLMASTPNHSTKTSSENIWLATEGEITIDKTTHDYGRVKQEDGAVTATFTITNNTQEPVVLTNVIASCGCTTPTWTKEPILPGKTGHVVASFNPKGRPGPINKTVTITTSSEPARIVVYLKGNVE
jgi:hypothetical protein